MRNWLDKFRLQGIGDHQRPPGNAVSADLWCPMVCNDDVAHPAMLYQPICERDDKIGQSKNDPEGSQTM